MLWIPINFEFIHSFHHFVQFIRFFSFMIFTFISLRIALIASTARAAAKLALPGQLSTGLPRLSTELDSSCYLATPLVFYQQLHISLSNWNVYFNNYWGCNIICHSLFFCKTYYMIGKRLWYVLYDQIHFLFLLFWEELGK